MDEALILCAVDLSGRCHLNFDVTFPDEYKVGDLDTELVKEFFEAFTRSAACTLHISKMYGENIHHIVEGVFKAFARALAEACSLDEKRAGVLPSTKGTL